MNPTPQINQVAISGTIAQEPLWVLNNSRDPCVLGKLKCTRTYREEDEAWTEHISYFDFVAYDKASRESLMALDLQVGDGLFITGRIENAQETTEAVIVVRNIQPITVTEGPAVDTNKNEAF